MAGCNLREGLFTLVEPKTVADLESLLCRAEGPHTVKNNGAQPARFIILELK